MKKILFTLLTFALGLGAHADVGRFFEGPLTVTVNGQPATQLATIFMTDGEGTSPKTDQPKMSFILPNFSLQQGGNLMFVGNVEIRDVECVEDPYTGGPAGQFSYHTQQSITIQPGSCPADAVWMGPMLGEVPVDLTCVLRNEEQMTASIKINIEMPGIGTIKVEFESEATGFENTDDLTVTVNGQSTTQKSTIYFTRDINEVPGQPEKDFSTIDLTLADFMLVQGGQTLYVGDIEIDKIKLNPLPGDLYLSEFEYTGDITVKPGKAAGVEEWIGPMLGTVPLKMKGVLNVISDAVAFTIDIDMQSTLGQAINVEFGHYGQYEGIDGPTVRSAAPGRAYNLAGQPEQALKGIVISGGKKLLIR